MGGGSYKDVTGSHCRLHICRIYWPPGCLSVCWTIPDVQQRPAPPPTPPHPGRPPLGWDRFFVGWARACMAVITRQNWLLMVSSYFPETSLCQRSLWGGSSAVSATQKVVLAPSPRWWSRPCWGPATPVTHPRHSNLSVAKALWREELLFQLFFRVVGIFSEARLPGQKGKLLEECSLFQLKGLQLFSQFLIMLTLPLFQFSYLLNPADGSSCSTSSVWHHMTQPRPDLHPGDCGHPAVVELESFISIP